MQAYEDLLTPIAFDTLEALAGFNRDRQRLMRERIERRAARARNGRRIEFLDGAAVLSRSGLMTVQQARSGQFDGSPIPHDLQRQWVQGTGPRRSAARRGRGEPP
jgi:malate synthase